MKRMEANHATQLSAMQNKLIAMERAQNNRFQPRLNNERWQRKNPPQDQRPPNQLESTNIVKEEAHPFYRACEDFHEESTCPIFCQVSEQVLFHEESTCPIFCQVNEQVLPESSNFLGYPRHIDHINNVGKPHPLSMELLTTYFD
jgi:hypothetical protein